jgi:hypothetical protein
MTILRHAALANFLWALPATRPVAAQQSPVQPVSWSLSLGLGGNALFGPSLGAEIVWYDAFGLRAGVGYDWYSPTRVVPLEAVGLFGGRGSQLEVAIGVTIATEGKGDPWNWDGTQTFFTGFLGYRHHAANGFLFRIGVVPLLWTNNTIPWVAMTFGMQLPGAARQR